jgi:hypothetical protein
LNLLDPESEPTDAELEALMREMMSDVRQRAVKANQALLDRMREETVKVRHRWGLNC